MNKSEIKAALLAVVIVVVMNRFDVTRQLVGGQKRFFN